MVEQTDLRKLLILHGQSLQAQGLLDFLSTHFQVLRVDTLDAALEEMRHQRFDAVMAGMGDFLPLERGAISQQASVVLDTIGDGVCIVGPGGELAWANQRLRNFPPTILDPLRRLCVQALEQFVAPGGKRPDRGKRFSLKPEDGSYYEVICSPVRDGQGVVRQVAAVVVNATVQRRQQLKLNAIDQAGKELVRLENTSGMDAMQRLSLLEDRILRCSRQVLEYQHFAILLLHERTNRLNLLVEQGLGEGVGKYELFANPEGSGICGYVAATGRSYICAEVSKDPRYLPGMNNARSCLAVPLRLQDKVIGVLNVESDREGAFGEEDRQFAEIFANYVALAMNILNLLVVERHSTASQLTGSLTSELVGPLNDMVSDLTELMEDYIGQDDLRRRLGAVVDNAHRARTMVQRLANASATGVFPSAGDGEGEKDAILAGKQVLVADDEELIRQTIRDVLAQYGCRVDTAHDGIAAKELLARGRYDMVVSDIRMPGASGYEVFAAAKAADASTAVILITGFGYDPNHSIVRATKEGLAAVLMKPFKVQQLLTLCRNALTPKAQ